MFCSCEVQMTLCYCVTSPAAVGLWLQALKTKTVDFLVQLLDKRIEGQDNQAACKAQIVKALKAMQCSLKHGEEVSQCLPPAAARHCVIM